jgi:hypothetical protein
MRSVEFFVDEAVVAGKDAIFHRRGCANDFVNDGF